MLVKPPLLDSFQERVGVKYLLQILRTSSQIDAIQS
jgi:hypothetical protein